MAKSNNGDLLLTLISIGLVFSIFVFLFFGCLCKRPFQKQGPFVETFEVEKGADKEKSILKSDGSNDGLTQKEKELFEDLRNNKLKDKEINELIQGGTLNETVLEKFMAALNTNLQVQSAMKSAATETFKDQKKEDKEGFVIEPFTGGGYARARR